MFTYDITTDIGLVRAQIPDAQDTPNNVFEDAEIQAYITLAKGNLTRAAARAIRVIASNRARLAKHLKVLDIDLDTTTAAKDLLAAAAAMEEADADDGSFAIAAMVSGRFARRERIVKELERDGGEGAEY